MRAEPAAGKHRARCRWRVSVAEWIDALSMVSLSLVDRVLGQGSPLHERIAFVRRGWSAHTILRPAQLGCGTPGERVIASQW